MQRGLFMEDAWGNGKALHDVHVAAGAADRFREVVGVYYTVR